MQKHINKIVLSLLLVFLLGGCGINFQWTKKNIPQPTPVEEKKPEDQKQVTKTIAESLKTQSQIYKFNNLEELKSFIEDNVGASGGSIMNYGRGGMESMTATKEMAMPTAVADMAVMGGGSEDYSSTNVQVAGVDEADIIKTDGQYIYALVGNDLYFILAYPAEKAEILSKISFKSRPENIYVNKDRLVVYGYDEVLYESELARSFRRNSQFTFFKVFDISDRKNPRQVSDMNFEGSSLSSRMVGDYIYFITQNYSYQFIEGEPIIPRVIEDGEVLSSDCGATQRCFVPDVYYFDMPYESINFVNIYAINIMDQSEPLSGNIYLANYGNEIYASLSNIYLTYTKYISEYELRMEVMRDLVYPRLPKSDKDRIDKIENADSDILSKQEKRIKIELVLENFVMTLSRTDQDALNENIDQAMKKKYQDIADELQKTVIHKIAYNKSDLEYIGFGEVKGRVLNQFSMDENNEYFRVATTRDSNWSMYADENNESQNNVFILDESMKTVGALEDLAPGERIYSARFMGDRMYLVTFEQIDPLFVIDLADPKNPQVLGKLKIPGFSNYLHPFDENTLIGIGKDTESTEDGRVKTKGVKVSLFDVSNVTDPRELDSYVLGDAGSDSIALDDHKAFLFSREKELLVIPVALRESSGNNTWEKLSFSGAAVFKITKDAIELRNKIDHSDGGKGSGDEWWGGFHYYDNTVKRSLYIDSILYTFSNKYLMLNDLNDLTELKKLEIKKEKPGDSDDFEIVN